MSSIKDKMWFFALSSDYHRRKAVQCTWQEAAQRTQLRNLMGIGFSDEDILAATGYDRLAVGLFPKRAEADGPLDEPMDAHERFVPFDDAEYPKSIHHVKEMIPRNGAIEAVVLDDWSTSMVLHMGATPQQMRRLAGAAHADPRIDLWGVYYVDWQLPRLPEYMSALDVANVWAWFPERLDQVERHMDMIDRSTGGKRFVVGVFTFDHARQRSLPIETMNRQLDRALRWLEEERIEGISLLGSDWMAPKENYPQVFASVSWTLDWLREIES